MYRLNLVTRLVLSVAFAITFASGCFKPETIRFFDDGTGEEKVVFKNLVAQFIIEKGFGHHVTFVPGQPSTSMKAIADNKVDVALVEANAGSNKDGNIMSLGDYFVRSELKLIVPDVLDFLTKMKLEEDVVNECIAWRDTNNTDLDNAVLYFLLNYQSKWKKWVKQIEYDYTKDGMSKLVEKSDMKDMF